MVCENPGCDHKAPIVDESLPPDRYVGACKADPEYVAPQRSAPDPPERIRLGSAIKAGLDKIGVTQDRVAALVDEIGLPPSCGGCAKRQEALDEFDRKAEAWLSNAANWFRGQS